MRQDPPPIGFQALFTAPQFADSLKLLGDQRLRSMAVDYRPWRKFRHVAKDAGLDPVQAWCAVKFNRVQAWRPLPPLIREEGGAFGLSIGAHLLEPLHRIDRATGGGGPALLAPEHGALSDEAHRARLRIRTLMDEAAESSIMEGAATTRKEAVELLRSGRTPRDKAERMVVNNYVAMQQVKQWVQRDLSVEMLLELQSMLTEGTLDKQDEAGRFRRPDESIRVVDDRDNTTIFVPPPAEQLSARLKKLCEFANQEHKGDEFLHPIVKACVLHFMVGYEHPFVDGNGRTARAVFYWFALRNGYGLFEYLAISELIRKGFAKYPQAYIDSEVDDGDLTYFVLYKLEIIEQALDRLAEHLRREEEKLRQSERFLRLSKDINLRQRLLLEHALRHPRSMYTVKSHMNSNGVSTNTARADLEDLVRWKLMTTSKRGKEVVYMAIPTLPERVARRTRSPR